MGKLLVLLLLTGNGFTATFSETAWKEVAPIYQKILKHPFNQELARGTLNKDVFLFYKNQDAFYLRKFSKALSLLATKLDNIADIKMILTQSKNSFDEDLSDVQIDLKGVAPSNFSYTHYLLSTASFGTKEELAAAILPCYWIYLQVARDLKMISPMKNPFSDWISLYSSQKYAKSVGEMINLTNKLSKNSSSKVREKMLLAFKIASKLELDFWDDAYHRREILP